MEDLFIYCLLLHWIQSHMDISLRSSFTAEITSLSFVKLMLEGNPKKECVVTHIDEWFAMFWHSKEVFYI